MFNLEQAIAQWRQQMLAAGIKTPVPLEELESHLRDEIEEQTKLGLTEQQAFETTILEFGQGPELQTEFAKERSWGDLLRGKHLPKRTKLILLWWIGMCIIGYLDVAIGLAYALLIISSACIAVAAYMVGIFWSLFLLNTQKRAGRIIQVIALLSIYLLLALMVLNLVRSSPHRVNLLMIPSYFGFFTNMVLELRWPTELKKAMK